MKTKPQKQKTYWALFVDGKLGECTINPTDPRSVMPALFLYKKAGEQFYGEVRRVQVVEVKRRKK